VRQPGIDRIGSGKAVKESCPTERFSWMMMTTCLMKERSIAA